MKLKLYLQKSLPFHFYQRKYQSALEWLGQIRQKILTNSNSDEYYQEFGLTNQGGLSAKLLRQILDIITYTEFDETFDANKIEDIFLRGNFESRDSIHNPVIQKLIRQGLQLVRESIDPAHGFSHTLRTARFVRIFYNELKKGIPDLDWGIAATAITWHDIYRVNRLGFLYSKNSLLTKFLRKSFLWQDLTIYSIHQQDSIGSSLTWLKHSRNILRNDLRLQIAIAILGEHKLEFLEKKVYPGVAVYKNLIHLADSLDNLSLGRWEETHRNVIYRHKADQNFLNRIIILNALFNLPKIKSKLTLKFARPIYDLVETTSLHHLKKFYPDDYALFKQSQTAKNTKK